MEEKRRILRMFGTEFCAANPCPVRHIKRADTTFDLATYYKI